jgi:hypothetical protein
MRKTILNCDQVFDVLTRGPFPTGHAGDAAVEHHLAACYECRQLAAALQPAVELLHEAIPIEEAADLPTYQGLLAAVDRRIATAEAMEESRADRTRVRSPRRARACTAGSRAKVDVQRLLSAVRLIAATVLISALGTLLWGLAMSAKNGDARSTAVTTADRNADRPTVRLDDRGLLLLASLNMPGVCFPRAALVIEESGQPAAEAVALATEHLQCCTLCHHQHHERAPGILAVAALQRSCVACHAL